MARSRDPIEELDRGLRALLRGGYKPLSLDNLDMLGAGEGSSRIGRSLPIEAELFGRVNLAVTVGAQLFEEIENEIRGATALAYGGLKGSGLKGRQWFTGGRLTGLLDVEVEPRVSAALTMRYSGLAEELDIWGGTMTEAGVFEKKGEGEEHALVEGVRRISQARAQVAGRADVDISLTDTKVTGRVESLGTEIDLKAFELMREARIQQSREVMAREARSFIALRAQLESERSKIAAILGE
jgi:hypothetical protein